MAITNPGPGSPDPQPPPGADAFDVPSANWRLIGQMLEAGRRDASAAGSGSSGIGAFLQHPINTLLTWLAYVVAWLLSKLLCVVAFVMRLITSVDDAAAPGLDAVVRASLEHVFQLPVGGTSPRKVAGALNTEDTGRKLGADIIASLTSGVGASSQLQPGSTAAENFLAKLAHIGIEGWVEGFIGEAVSLGQFKAIMELTPIMADVLGLGRLSRRVLAPPLKILVEDPYTWKLNLAYRPTLLAHDQAIREYLRGAAGWDRAKLDDTLGRQGFNAAAIDALINLNTKRLADSDVDYLVARGHWSQAQGVQAYRDVGYDEATANILLALAIDKRLDAHNQELLNAQIDAFMNGEIDAGALHDAFTQSTMPDGEKAVAEAVAVMKRQLNVTHLSLAQVETLIKAHIMSVDDLRVWMTRANYPEEEQTLLELWLFGTIESADQAAAAKLKKQKDAAAAAIAKQQAAEQKAAAAAAKAAVAGVSLANFQQLVKSGLRTFDDYRAFLSALGLKSPAIQDLLDLLHQQITAQQTLEQKHSDLQAAAAVKHLPLSQTEAAVVAGVLSIGELQKFMAASGYAADDINIVTAFVQAKIDAAKSSADARRKAAAALAARGLSLADLERAVKLGVLSMDEYQATLTAVGFAADAIAILTASLQAELTSIQKTTAAAGDVSAALAAKGISLAQEQLLVKNGLATLDQYQAFLTGQGYAADDAAALRSLLDLQLQQLKAAAAAHQLATEKAAAKSISLAKEEEAVIAGIRTMDDYQALLVDLGFNDLDQATLVALLQSRVAAAIAKAAASSPTTPAP
jgi:hypothetical protein